MNSLQVQAGLTIHQVARQTGVSVHTLRYYERVGLLNPVNRATNGHRRYSAEDVAGIKFFTRLRTTGMPIRQMQKYAALVREGSHTHPARLELLLAHQAKVETQLKELEEDLQIIKKKIVYYKEINVFQ